ncbi:MAG: PilZ domain-containing protein [Pseudomonadota bacterium]
MSRRAQDKRQHPRYPLHWQVAVVYDHVEERTTFHGVTHEISVSGLSLLTDHNIFTEDPVTLLLAIPPLHHGQRKKIVEVRANMAYTVHAAGHDKFRIGLHFKRFKDDGRAFLERNLKERAVITTNADVD